MAQYTLMIDVLESRTSQLGPLAVSLSHRDQDMPVTVQSQETSTFGISKQTKIKMTMSRTFPHLILLAMGSYYP